jgi:hypothetical protein
MELAIHMANAIGQCCFELGESDGMSAIAVSRPTQPISHMKGH